ncbi:MAG: hypothetical protein MUD06_10795 [Rhodospirillales bacterium]|jgi:hypothetical protein|nr:hypothetical protein [Rhodospirillales bacterium]
MRAPHAYPVKRPRFIPCGRPDCAICRHNIEGEPPDSGHPTEERLALELLTGAVGIGLLFVLLFVLLPVLAA